MNTKPELDFLRELEQDIQRLLARIREHYSGSPETVAIQSKLNTRIADLLEAENGKQA